LLKDCVCGECNTRVFSKLETKVLRSSPIAISRLFLQSRTRDRGSKTGAPSLQPMVSYFQDEGSKILLEQELEGGGKPVVLPQLSLAPPNILSLVAANLDVARAFMAKVTSALSDEVTVVEKVREGFEARFDLLILVWRDDAYAVLGREPATKPPGTEVIWFEQAIRPITAPDDFLLPPRIYQRARGQLVCRGREYDVVPMLLTVFRHNLAAVSIPDEAPVQTASQPGVHQRINFDMEAHDRFLAKTGLNLCAKLLFARHPAFDRVREYARTGEGAIYKVRPENMGPISSAFGPGLPRHHVLMLLPAPGENDPKTCIVLVAQFYGGSVEAIRLAEFAGPVPTLSEAIVIVVDYEGHVIRRMTVNECNAFAATISDAA
jgi:hypothetical protein